jgi:AcrR family transcriptional regulator
MLSTVPEAKLDPRVKRTRQLIGQAFTELIAQKGFQAVSVQDIAERAGVNRATFYAHFQDKYDLLDQGIRQGFRQEIEKRMLNACEYSADNLRLLVVAVCEFVSGINSHCTPPQMQFESLVEPQIKHQLQELLQKWFERAHSAVEARTAATAVSWAIYGLASQWSHDKSKSRPSAEAFAKQVLPLLVSPNLKARKSA